MRLCSSLSLSLSLAAAAVVLPGPAYAEPGPTCAGSDDRHFPITTRIQGGPGAYEAGGGYGTFDIQLTNTTARSCAAIHPVVVLVDDKRALQPGQPKLEFYDGGRPHAVRFETTDKDELVGAFDGGLPGFTVGPKKTVSVKVRLALTSDAVANTVTAKAAVVQRHADDGDWVGQSNDYRFRIETGTETGTESRPATATATAIGKGTAPKVSPTPSAGASASVGTDEYDDGLPFADELARTGLTTPHGMITTCALLLAAGGTVLVTRRRR